MVETAGVEREKAGFRNLLMVRGFWANALTREHLTAARRLLRRPLKSPVFDRVPGDIEEAQGKVSRSRGFRRRRHLRRVPIAGQPGCSDASPAWGETEDGAGACVPDPFSRRRKDSVPIRDRPDTSPLASSKNRGGRALRHAANAPRPVPCAGSHASDSSDRYADVDCSHAVSSGFNSTCGV
jgi:hypothetical protein